MALTGTDRGTGTHNTSATTFTLSPASNFTAGALAVICISADNAHASGTAFTTFTVTDTLGNTWTRRASPLNDPGAASAGVEGAIFTTPQNGGVLQTGTVITVTFDTATTAKCWTLMEVTGANGVPKFVTSGTGTGGTGTTSPTITTGSIANADMVIAALFLEAGTTETITQDGDTTNGPWSAQQTNEIGSTTSGQNVASQRKVVTATATQTYNPTLGIAGDLALAWIQVTQEVAISGTAGVTQDADALAADSDLVGKASAALTQAADGIAATATIANASANAVLEQTQVADAVGAAGALKLAGAAAITQAGQAVGASGVLPITAAVTLAQAGNAVESASTLRIAGGLTQTQDSQQGTESGILPIVGQMQAVQAGQVLAATGSGSSSPTVFGELAITQASDALVALGGHVLPAPGSVTIALMQPYVIRLTERQIDSLDLTETQPYFAEVLAYE